MRIAVLADVHGNLPALRAVLAEVDHDRIDSIVVAGDAVGGPFPRQALDVLDARTESTHWISGNSEREAIAVYDGAPASDDPAGRAAGWSAQALDRRWREALASWPISLKLGGVRFCHGSPRRDDEVITRATPDEIIAEALTGVTEPLVVGGHTHQQTVRRIPGGLTYANAGSVGMPYEGRPGAFWMVVDHGIPELRETPYDLDAAIDELLGSGFGDAGEQVTGSLLQPLDPNWVTAFFEHGAGRGEDPGDPMTVGS